MLFGRSQDALKADHEEIAEQVRADVLGSPAHVFLLEAVDPFADGGLDLSLCFHGALARLPFPDHVAVEEDLPRATEPGSPVLGPASPTYKKAEDISLAFSGSPSAQSGSRIELVQTGSRFSRIRVNVVGRLDEGQPGLAGGPVAE
jgi:hypothetical protein